MIHVHVCVWYEVLIQMTYKGYRKPPRRVDRSKEYFCYCLTSGLTWVSHPEHSICISLCVSCNVTPHCNTVNVSLANFVTKDKQLEACCGFINYDCKTILITFAHVISTGPPDISTTTTGVVLGTPFLIVSNNCSCIPGREI